MKGGKASYNKKPANKRKSTKKPKGGLGLPQAVGRLVNRGQVARPLAQGMRPQPEKTDSQKIFNDYYDNIKNMYLQKIEQNMKKLDELKKNGIKSEDNNPNIILKLIIEEYCRKANAILTNKFKIGDKDHPVVKNYWNILMKYINTIRNNEDKKRFIDNQCSTINTYLHKIAAEYIKRISREQNPNKTSQNQEKFKSQKMASKLGPIPESISQETGSNSKRRSNLDDSLDYRITIGNIDVAIEALKKINPLLGDEATKKENLFITTNLQQFKKNYDDKYRQYKQFQLAINKLLDKVFNELEYYERNNLIKF